jgi:hypothetical protein
MALRVKLSINELATITSRLKIAVKEMEDYKTKYPFMAEMTEKNIQELQNLINNLESQWQDHLNNKD